jgi:hypothetical protein
LLSLNLPYSRSFLPDPASELNVLGHDGDTLCMDGAQVGVLEESHKVGLGYLLQGKDCRSLEAFGFFPFYLEFLGDLADETLEGELSKQQIGGFLITTDLTESDGSWAVTVGLLDAGVRAGWRLTTARLGGELLAGRKDLASGGFAGGLFGAGHFGSVMIIDSVDG